MLGIIGVVLSPEIITIYRDELITFVDGKLGKIYYYVLIISAELASILLIVASIEILISKDRNFVLSVFSALTSLVALIVAFVALG